MKQQKKFGEILGGLSAYILLGLYVAIVLHLIGEVWQCSPSTQCDLKEFNDGTVYIVTTISGLISALVVSKLTLADPTTDVTVRSQRGIHWKRTLELTYLAFWVITGLGALVVGVIIRPDVNATLSDIGTNWFGLAVASAFAYFGLKPPTQPIPPDEDGQGNGSTNSNGGNNGGAKFSEEEVLTPLKQENEHN